MKLNEHGTADISHKDIADAMYAMGKELLSQAREASYPHSKELLHGIGRAIAAAGQEFQKKHEEVEKLQVQLADSRRQAMEAFQKASEYRIGEARKAMDPKRPKEWWRVW
jgi:hypothetical protein